MPKVLSTRTCEECGRYCRKFRIKPSSNKRLCYWCWLKTITFMPNVRKFRN